MPPRALPTTSTPASRRVVYVILAALATAPFLLLLLYSGASRSALCPTSYRAPRRLPYPSVLWSKVPPLPALSTSPHPDLRGSRWIVFTASPHAPRHRPLRAVPGWQVLAVADEATPADWSHPGAVLLTLTDQGRLGFSSVAFLPARGPARKAAAYLFAVQRGARVIYDADARRTAYILGTVIGNCKLFPAERAPRDWSGYANVITVTAGEDGPVVTAGLQKRVTFRPKGEDETVAAAELIAKAFCPPEAPMPTDALKARIDAFLEAHNTLALATGCGKWVRCTPLEYLRVDGRLYILTEGGLKFKGIWWNGAISAAVFDSYAGMASLAGLQMTGTAVYIDPLSDEYRSVIEARGVQLQQLQQMPAMLHAVRLDITRYELLDGALRADGYAARQVLDLG